MRFRSVRTRLIFWNTGMLALVLLVFLVAVHFAVRTFLLRTMDQRLVRESRNVLLYVARSGGGIDQISQRLLALPLGRRQQRAIRLYDPQGQSVDVFGNQLDAAPWDAQALSTADAGRELLSTRGVDGVPTRIFTSPILLNGSVTAVMQVALPLNEVHIVLGSLTLILLVLSPLALIAAGLGGVLLTDRVLRPVRQITQTADKLNADDLSRRLPVSGDDEFAHLAVTINRLLARLDEAFARLGRSVEQERRFTADASHELRTPLTAIKANTSLALRGTRTPEEYRETLIAIDQSADTMGRLVQDLLLLARSDNGQLTPACQAVDPAALFQEALATVRHGADTADVQTQIAGNGLRIWGDPHHLTRVVVNLLENALRHTPSTGQVTLTATGVAEQVVLSVSDTGEGIPREHLAHLCERFFRVDTARTRKHGGTGLGLAICRSIVEAHHGKLQIDSSPGHGTTVTVLLPRAKG
jgi:heavy metal sensor kinase